MQRSHQSQTKDEALRMDPDVLFTKHTVSEIRVIQDRTRADAEAKQEELRLMVGERYRDLLQASTSIISIARSSQRVKSALEEAREAVEFDEEPSLSRRGSVQTEHETHLHTLQLLSAHIKLLLDAPEHLWRLIENKQYFPAAWLFLLARVVHRALIRDVDREERTWSNEGIDVLEEFPLVQRQWDAISQFRSQIVHKATVSLREPEIVAEDVCATLLTLYLLDSRPLTDTVIVFLNQRSKTLTSSLGWRAPITRRTDGSPPEKAPQASTFRRNVALKEIKDAAHATLSIVSYSMSTARRIFLEEQLGESLISRVLRWIQAEADTPSTEQPLPTTLGLTTEALLSTLPSSTHLLLLPPVIKSYRPYVDLSSSAARISQIDLSQKLQGWFGNALTQIQTALKGWFAGLDTVKEVWTFRSVAITWIQDSGYETQEADALCTLFNDETKQRITQIWALALTNAGELFTSELSDCIRTVDASSKSSSGSLPLDFVFQHLPVPSFHHTGSGANDAPSFAQYKTTLEERLVGRTALLNKALSSLEECARSIHRDLTYVMRDSEAASQPLLEQLSQSHHPDADLLCQKVVRTLESAVNDSQESMRGLAFIGRITDELGTSSPFPSKLECHPKSLQAFRETVIELRSHVLDHWRAHAISESYGPHRAPSRSRLKTAKSEPSGPSNEVLDCLLRLTNAVLQIGVSRDPENQELLVQSTIRDFITTYLQPDVATPWDLQTVLDAAFLSKFTEVQGEPLADLNTTLADVISNSLPVKNRAQVQATVEQATSETFARTQILFAALLPYGRKLPSLLDTKSSALLSYGSPSAEQPFHSALDLAKPSSRFGLLLVSSTEA